MAINFIDTKSSGSFSTHSKAKTNTTLLCHTHTKHAHTHARARITYINNGTGYLCGILLIFSFFSFDMLLSIANTSHYHETTSANQRQSWLGWVGWFVGWLGGLARWVSWLGGCDTCDQLAVALAWVTGQQAMSAHKSHKQATEPTTTTTAQRQRRHRRRRCCAKAARELVNGSNNKRRGCDASNATAAPASRPASSVAPRRAALCL